MSQIRDKLVLNCQWEEWTCPFLINSVDLPRSQIRFTDLIGRVISGERTGLRDSWTTLCWTTWLQSGLFPQAETPQSSAALHHIKKVQVNSVTYPTWIRWNLPQRQTLKMTTLTIQTDCVADGLICLGRKCRGIIIIQLRLFHNQLSFLQYL